MIHPSHISREKGDRVGTRCRRSCPLSLYLPRQRGLGEEYEPGAEEDMLDKKRHLTLVTSAGNTKTQEHGKEMVTYRRGSCPHAILCEYSYIYKNTFAQCPFVTNGASLRLRTSVKKQGIQKYTKQLCTSAFTCTFRLTKVDLKEMLQNVKAIYVAGVLGQITCVCRWGSHREECKSSDISKLHQRNITRKRKIQSPPLILKLVNNYLGGISYVLILVGL